MDAFEAARLGVLVHGLAGDRASAAIGGLGMVAGDLPDAIAAVMAQGRSAKRSRCPDCASAGERSAIVSVRSLSRTW